MTEIANTRRGLAATAVLAVLLVLGGGAALAQQQAGNVFGVVTDNADSRLPGVTITLTGAGAPMIQVTDDRGQFRFPGLAPGRYQVSAQLEGFSAVDYPNVQVNIGRNTDLQITLTPAVEETITVTSESPLLDERKIQAGTTVSQIELEKIPTARDPWAILTQTPGVLTDRINVGGNESGQQAVFNAGGQASSENTFAVDGVVITDMSAIGSSPTYYDFDQFEEMQVSTGGSDITAITGGVTMNLVTKRGTNEPRGSARYFLTDSDKMLGLFEEADPDIEDELAPGQSRVTAGNRINEIIDYGFEAGGPVVQDRLWLWGTYGRNDIKQFVASGAADDTLLENSALKLNGQVATNNSAVASFNRGDKLKFGRNAGRTRPTETTWDQTGPTELWKLEDTHIFSANLYLTGLYSFVDGGFALAAKGGSGPSAPEVFQDADGIWRRGFQSGISGRDTSNYQLDGSYFFNTGNMDHELKFGGSFREFEVASDFGWTGRNMFFQHGFPNGVAGCADRNCNRHIATAMRAGEAPSVQEYTAAWAQDTLTWGNLTLTAGVRYDLQQAVNEPASVGANPGVPNVLPALEFQGNEAGFEWETLSPRLGATYALGEGRDTLLRASYARFAEQLESGDITRINPVGTAYAYFYFTDLNNDIIWQPNEPIELFGANGFNPNDPTALENPNINDPNLDAPMTDELILGIEHSLLPELVVGLQGTYRLVSDLHTGALTSTGLNPAYRLLDPAACNAGVGARGPAGTCIATRNDYVFRNDLTGTLPDGSSYSVPVYELTPAANAALTGGSLRTNTGVDREYLGLNFNFTKRLSNRWMARGYFNWSDATWQLSDEFLFFDDPTNVPASFDDDGEVFAEQSGGSGNKGDVWVQSTWSANLNGMYQVAPDRPWGFNVAANLFAREGYPLPYYRNGAAREGAKQVSVSEFDQFRTDDIFTTDLRVEKDIPFAENLSATLSLDCFNVFNENYVLQRERNLGGTSANFLDETLSPRIYRLGFRLNWR